MDCRNEMKRCMSVVGKLKMLTAIVLAVMFVFLLPAGVKAETDAVTLTGSTLKECGKGA